MHKLGGGRALPPSARYRGKGPCNPACTQRHTTGKVRGPDHRLIAVQQVRGGPRHPGVHATTQLERVWSHRLAWKCGMAPLGKWVGSCCLPCTAQPWKGRASLRGPHSTVKGWRPWSPLSQPTRVCVCVLPCGGLISRGEGAKPHLDLFGGCLSSPPPIPDAPVPFHFRALLLLLYSFSWYALSHLIN